MKPILLDLPMPIHTERLLIRPPKPGDGPIINSAIVASYKTLKQYMPWAQTLPSIEDSEEFARLAAANWILKKDEEPYLNLSVFRKDTMAFVGSTGFHLTLRNPPVVNLHYHQGHKFA